jgi:hypothetical protein
MAIIKYQLESGNVPSYITDGGYFPDSSNETLIGIGSGGGTELTQAELLTYIKAMGIRKIVWADFEAREVRERVAMTDSECETLRDAWLIRMGIS